MSDQLAFLSVDLEPGETGAPDLVHLLPAGRITARDGRTFVLEDPETVVARSMPPGAVDLPVDYEHANDNPEARRSGPVPAAGWIKELLSKPDGIWGRVEWTDRAKELITAREYRYLSPAILHSKGTGVIRKIKGAGLVHNPALELTALAREEDEAAPSLARIATALGLDEDAGEVAILSEIEAKFELDPSRYIPTGKVAELMVELRETKTALCKLEASNTVDDAVRSGKVPPAMRDWALALCMSDPDAYRAFETDQAERYAHLFAKTDWPDNPPCSADTESTEASIARQLGIAPARLRD